MANDAKTPKFVGVAWNNLQRALANQVVQGAMILLTCLWAAVAAKAALTYSEWWNERVSQTPVIIELRNMVQGIDEGSEALRNSLEKARDSLAEAARVQNEQNRQINNLREQNEANSDAIERAGRVIEDVARTQRTQSEQISLLQETVRAGSAQRSDIQNDLIRKEGQIGELQRSMQRVENQVNKVADRVGVP